MNKRDLVLVASRVIALYLLIPVALDLLSLSVNFLFVRGIGSGVFGDQVARAFYRAIPSALLTDAAKLVLGWSFWKCGPTVEKLFSE